MTSTEKSVIMITEKELLDFYEKYNVPLEERKNFNGTAQKTISNNIPNLAKALEQRKSKSKYLYVASFIAIIISIVFWYFIIINILK